MTIRQGNADSIAEFDFTYIFIQRFVITLLSELFKDGYDEVIYINFCRI